MGASTLPVPHTFAASSKDRSNKVTPLQNAPAIIHNHEVGGSSPPRATEATFQGGLSFMRHPLIASLLPVLLVACAHRFGAADERAIRAAMQDQEQAWDAGDIDAFMQGYSDSICFVDRRGMECGKATVTARYRSHYPDRKAMGDLTFGITEVRPAGGDHAWVTGNWELRRVADTIGGGFSLLWERERAGWRIVRDHTY